MKKIVIIGAGPAGMGCAYELFRLKINNTGINIFDKNASVGGLSRTYNFKGHYFDVGPHRLFTKNGEVESFWKTILGKELIQVPRLSRIIYQNKFFLYPIQIKDVLIKLGFIQSLNCVLSFINAKFFLVSLKPKTFEDWITKNFGKKLYKIFFKTYFKKVWGLSPDKIGAEWAAQRIKKLNFQEVIKKALLGKRATNITSLINNFYYPKRGSGQVYQRIEALLKMHHNIQIHKETEVVEILHKKNKIFAIRVKYKNHITTHQVDYLFSSMPLTHFILALNPAPKKIILDAARKLYYRDHITVNLLVRGSNLFPDNWLYVHSPEVKMARIGNYNNFNPTRRNASVTAISVEYFCTKNDKVWKKSDAQLVELAKNELVKVTILNKADIVNSFIVRETESYPVYFMGHKKYFDLIKTYAERFINLQLIGRGGMYRYNNMDHSIYTGFLAARNFNLGYKKFDLWKVNEDAEYLEEEKKNG